MKQHEVQAIDFDGPTMRLKVDGQTYNVNLPSVSDRLAQAADSARQSYSVSPSGYGIHWPQIDEDLTVDGLVAAARGEAQTAMATGTLRDTTTGPTGGPLHAFLRRVLEHVEKSESRFRTLHVSGLNTAPIPFFGNIEAAEIITVGVNPSRGEFSQKRNWLKSRMTADYLESRLRNYFLLGTPPPHPWFRPWEESLRLLKNSSYKRNAAHLDLSPRPTQFMSQLPAEDFIGMVDQDLPLFFEALSLCRRVKVLLLAGSVTERFYMNEYIRDRAPRFGFDLLGKFERTRGGRITSKHLLTSKTAGIEVPAFFFSRGPAFREELVELVSSRNKEILDCVDAL